MYNEILLCDDMISDGWGARKAGPNDLFDAMEYWSSVINRQIEFVLRLTSIQ